MVTQRLTHLGCTDHTMYTGLCCALQGPARAIHNGLVRSLAAGEHQTLPKLLVVKVLHLVQTRPLCALQVLHLTRANSEVTDN